MFKIKTTNDNLILTQYGFEMSVVKFEAINRFKEIIYWLLDSELIAILPISTADTLTGVSLYTYLWYLNTCLQYMF